MFSKIKRLISSSAAIALAASCMTVSAFAEAAEKKEIPFEYEKTMTTTESSAPAISFDGDDWTKYVHTTSDASAIGLKISIDKTTYYQGFSLKATSSGGQTEKFFTNASTVRDSDNNMVYPGSDSADATFICPGVELKCEDFGLSCFDGCFITFYYRIGSDAEGKLMGDSIYAFATDDVHSGVFSSLLTLKYDKLMSNNVTQYRPESIAVPPNSASTRIVFETAVTEALSSDIFCLDNISIKLPVKDGDNDLYIKPLDGYNASATPQTTIEEIQVKEKKESTVEIGSTPEKQEGGNGFIVVIVLIAVAAAGGVIVFFFIKKKRRYL